MENRNIEILAPAKDLFHGIQAINCGADSVYIACSKLGLRKRCTNSLEDIKKLTEYAHRYWVKVYVTINSTIYKDDLFEEIQELIYELYQIGVDAIIISDMGILTLNLPPIPIYASVNTRCFSSKKINFFENIGLKRIILPRELSFDEIKEIKHNTNIPLEVFVHGTFCVAYSGNCYLKYTQNIKKTNGEKNLIEYQIESSNNGACIANCSDKYNLLDAHGNYIIKNEKLLNLRYLNLIDELQNFIDIGIHSFKIEGRQRELSYVKNIVALFNERTNNILKENNYRKKRLSSGKSFPEFIPKLENIFNKGFTTYFFNGRKPELLKKNMPYGEYIGSIKTFKNNHFTLDNNTKLNKGDRLLFIYDKNKEPITINIINTNNNIYETNISIKEDITNALIYRISNAEKIREIDNAKSYRLIYTKLIIEEKNKKEYLISVIDEDNIKIQIAYSKDSNEKINLTDILQEFQTIDEWEFFVEKIKSNSDLYINKNKLNTLKSDLYLKLRKEREKNRPKEEGNIINNTIKYPEKITYHDNIANSKSEKFYQQHGVKKIIKGIETNINIENKSICSTKYCIKYEMGFCTKTGKKNPHCEPWVLEDRYGFKYKLYFDCQKCQMDILG